MAQRQKSKTKRPANRFYHSAKVSEYQFKRVLWAFVLDQPVAEAAKHIDLSANSISAIYQKLRVYFTELGVFEDIYAGGDPHNGTPEDEDMEGFEYRLLTFHLRRLKEKRRIRDTRLDEIDYQWCEDFWRFHYSILTDGRPSGAVHRMMYSHLLTQIRLCGPIGLPPANREAGLRLNRQYYLRRLLWLEKNSPNFRDEKTRARLKAYREEQESRNL